MPNPIVKKEETIRPDKSSVTSEVTQNKGGLKTFISNMVNLDLKMKGISEIISFPDKGTEEYYLKILDEANGSILTEDWIDKENKKLIDNGIDIDNYCDNDEQKEMFNYYLLNVEKSYSCKDKSLEEKCAMARNLMLFDKSNNYQMIHNTPMLMNGIVDTGMVARINYENETRIRERKYKYNGEYLKFYNENGINIIAPLSQISALSDGYIFSQNPISENDRLGYINNIAKYYSDLMDNSKNYSDKFNRETANTLNTIFMASFAQNHKNDVVEGDWGAYVERTYDEEQDCPVCDMVIDTSLYRSFPNDDYVRISSMIGEYTHELGHVYATASSRFNKPKVPVADSSSNILNSKEWLEVFSQLRPYANDIEGPLRTYALTNPDEAFAECCAEYFESSKGFLYNPNDLKTIDLVVNGKRTNLYDVMDAYLND